MARANEGGPNKSTLAKTLEVALANRKLSDELLALIAANDTGELYTAVSELQTAFNALLVKLDADVGVTDTDYESSLSVTPL